jgi:hypothetical protein
MPGEPGNWPAAFTEYNQRAAHEMKPVAHKEAAKSEEQPVAAGPIVAAGLQAKAARVCGGMAKDVKVIVRPDRSVVVQVRPVLRSAEGALIERLSKLPEMTAPNVHVEFDLTPSP